jgi:hypothetical protein
MQKVIQLTAIAGLAKKVAGSNLRETVAHLEIADVTSQGESKEQDRPTTTFGSFQFASSDRISTMVALLGDWNEPEYVADQHNSVSNQYRSTVLPILKCPLSFSCTSRRIMSPLRRCFTFDELLPLSMLNTPFRSPLAWPRPGWIALNRHKLSLLVCQMMKIL